MHSDLNACFASIECVLNPSLKGKPVAVGGSTETRHGIILAKSQEAKVCGVKTGEVIWQAKQKCPELIIIHPHYDQYVKYAELARDIYRRYTDLVEPFGLDECWLDVTGSTKLLGSGTHIANEIRETMKSELGLTVSVGVSFNKIFAKLGSDMKKPDAVTVITREEFKQKVWPLDASDLLGVGRSTAKKLAAYGINTIGELAKSDAGWMGRVFGKCGTDLWRFANGIDDSRVRPDGFRPPVKSVGHGITCTADLLDNREVWTVLLELSQTVGRRLKGYGLSATGVQVMVRDSNLAFSCFRTRLPFATRSATELARAATALFAENYTWKRDVRSVTITAINLISCGEPVQLDFFSDYKKHEKQERIDDTVIRIRSRFGEKAVFNACLMELRKVPRHPPKEAGLPGQMYR